MKFGKYGGMMMVVMSLLGLILFASLFATILTAIGNIRYGATALTNYTAFDTVLGISPVILWLGGLFGAGYAYYKGYSITAGQDQNGWMRMIMGVLTLVLFATLFLTVFSNINTVYGTTNAGNYTAFQTVVGITPTVLFLGGVFAAIYSGVQGVRARRRSRYAMA